MNPEIAYSKFSDYVFESPFEITGFRKTVIDNKNISYPILHELGINYPFNFHVVKWHDFYDALIGTDDFENLQAKIDYRNNLIELDNIKIPFSIEYTTRKFSETKTCNKTIPVPVTILQGDVITPEIKFQHFSLPASINKAFNGYCYFPNPIEKPVQINFTERIPVDSLFTHDIELPKSRTTPQNITDQLRTQHMNMEEKTEISKLCKQYSDIFYQESSNLTFTNAIKHHIRTTDDTPVYVKSFRHPPAMKTEISSQIKKLLDDNIIRPSISPYSAPVWIVPKKADASGKRKYRMVIDFRKLNDKTIEDKYTIPRIDEILDNLGRCTYFTTLDLAQGFHQIELHPDSIEKTAFSVPNAHYEYLRLPYGLKNGPSTFQRVMDNILKEYLHKSCFVYMDDVIVFSKSLQEHLSHLKQIFSKFRQFNLKVQLEKCEFLRKDVAFLGHVITPSGIKPNPEKIMAIQNYALPTTTKQIKQFLGLVGYYRRFIQNFARIVQPLTKCLRKDSKLNINDDEYIKAFEYCKELICNAPILTYPDFEQQFTLTTDASNVAIGSVLSQNSKPIAFYSRVLNSAEKNYSTIEKELLAIVDSCKHFRPYLFGQKFIIETDHRPLVWLSKLKEPNARLVRWRLKLEEYNFEIRYQKGKTNYVADALSRQEINALEDNESIIPQINENPTLTDEDFDSLRQQSDNYVPPTISNYDTAHSKGDFIGKTVPISEKPANHFPVRFIFNISESYSHKTIILFGEKITHKFTLRFKHLEADLHRALEIIDLNKSNAFYFIDHRIRPTFLAICQNLFNDSVKLFLCNTYLKDVTKSEEQKELTKNYHDKTHNGIHETYEHLRKEFYWPKMKDTISNIVNQCNSCLRSKYERNPYKIPLQGPISAKRPFDTLHIDTYTFQNTKFLTIIDLFSRYAQAYNIRDTNAITICNKLRHYFSHHGYPKRIVCDSGVEFKNKTVQEYLKLLKIELHFTTVDNPNSNSPIERLHSTITEKLRILRLETPKDTPADWMATAVLVYNSSIHSATKHSPFYLLYGPYEREPDIDLELTIYEHYNEKRKKELLPFYDELFNKMQEQANARLNRQNQNSEAIPTLENKQVYLHRAQLTSKNKPIYDTIEVEKQDKTKLFGKYSNNRNTTVNLAKVKRVRHVPSLQDNTPGSEQPSTSSSH